MKNLIRSRIRQIKHFSRLHWDVRSKVIILLFHRVLPHIDLNPFGAVVSLKTFKNQIEFLSSNFSIISLSDAISQIKRGETKSKLQIVLTFDDGFIDNYVHAFPLLKSKGLRATFFLTTNYIDQHETLWDWELAKAMAKSKNNFVLQGINTNETLERDVAQDDVDFLWKVIRRLKCISPNERTNLLNTIYKEIGYEVRSGEADKCMSWEDVRVMQSSGMEFGSHGCSHSSLAQIPFHEARSEIHSSKNIIEEKIGNACFHFAFPHGSTEDYGENLIDEVRKAGYYDCLLNVHGYNYTDQDAFSLKRKIIFEDTEINYILG
jgi:peptidoglycan/xylan/chitin deacetylase (PgdA/CDA1 family)